MLGLETTGRHEATTLEQGSPTTNGHASSHPILKLGTHEVTHSLLCKKEEGILVWQVRIKAQQEAGKRLSAVTAFPSSTEESFVVYQMQAISLQTGNGSRLHSSDTV